MPVIEQSNFYRSERLSELVYDCETLYASDFCRGDESPGDDLTVKPAHASRSMLFFIGLSLGLIIAMLAVLAVWLTLNPAAKTVPRFLAALPVLRGAALLIFTAWAWAAVVYACQQAHVNYVFVLDADPRTALNYQQVLAAAGTLTLVLIASTILFVALLVYTDASAPGWSHAAMTLVLLALAACPFDIAFRATRIFVWETLRDTVLAPFSGAVMFHHFFIADFVTSLVRALQDTAYSLCFYFTGEFIAVDSSAAAPRCETSITYIVFAYLLALLPYYWRLMQCVRRYRDDPARQGAQLWNAAKYGAAMLATAVNWIARSQPDGSGARTALVWVWAALAFASSMYSFGWDVYKDWGLFQYLSPHFPLRAALLFPTWFYYAAIATDFVLRLSWIITISPHAFGFASIPQPFFLFGVALLEVARRALWAVLRLEHEHLANVEHYRVTAAVPLLFATGGSGDGDSDGGGASSGAAVSGAKIDAEEARVAAARRQTQPAETIEAGIADHDDEQAGLVIHAGASSTSLPPPSSSSSTLSTTARAKLLVRVQREIGLAADADDANDSGLSGSDSDFDE